MPQSSTLSNSIPLLQPSRIASRMHLVADSDLELVTFVEKRFLPNHVQHKSISGRAHYHAILKHVLKPETMDRLLQPYTAPARTRLKTIPDWPYLDGVLLSELSPEHVRQLVLSATRANYSPQTVKHIRNVVSAILAHARREGFVVASNAVSDVDLPAMARRRAYHLTIQQTRIVLDSMNNPMRAAALLTILTGMNISQICALQWRHVNLTDSPVWSQGEFLPAESIAAQKQYLARKSPDSNSHRYLPLARPLLQTLAELKESGCESDADHYVLGGATSLRPGDLKLKPIARKLHMPWLSWQVLRRAHEDLISELRTRLADDLIGG